VARASQRNVFLNCPFDENYIELLRPLLFTVVRLGFNPTIANERSDSGELRLDKILKLIRGARFSIHDLSRIQAKKSGEFYRLNMPFELGLEFGCRRFGGRKHQSKKTLVLGSKEYAYMKAISDIAGIDIQYHRDNPIELVLSVRNWFSGTVGVKSAPSGSVIWSQFMDFMVYFNDEHKRKGFKRADFKTMSMAEYLRFMKRWVKRQETG